MMDTNTWGTLRCIQAVVPHMRERRSGTIVNVTSLTGRMVMGGHAAYSMSKVAAEALTENLAIEMVPFGVRVAAVEPGLVRTPLVRKAPPPAEPGSPYAPLGERAGLFYPAIYRNTGRRPPRSPRWCGKRPPPTSPACAG